MRHREIEKNLVPYNLALKRHILGVNQTKTGWDWSAPFREIDHNLTNRSQFGNDSCVACQIKQRMLNLLQEAIIWQLAVNLAIFISQ